MMKLAYIIGTLLALNSYTLAVDWDVYTPLDAYVGESEEVYGYDVISIEKVTGATVHVLNMTSLTWFDETLTTRPVWFHYFTVVIPDNLIHNDIALLDIDAGDNPDPPPTNSSVQYLVDFSIRTGGISSSLKQIPNQPLYFTNEDNGTFARVEDSIIAYTWMLYVEQNVTNREVNLLFPMVKAAKQAVDTLVEYTSSINSSIEITGVMPMGYSKRGWTSWLLGCVDQRVYAMAPIVFDFLNFYENLQSHYKSIGGWSWALAAYWESGITGYLHHPRTLDLCYDMDALTYNERLTMPKHLHGATGDQFFLPDGTHHWYKNITGEMHYMIFENDEHNLADHRVPLWENIENLFVSVKEGIARPEYTFTRSTNDTDQSGTITLTSITQPNYVKVWWADNTNRTCEPDDDISGTCRRDFRITRFEEPRQTLIYHEEDVPTNLGNGVYESTYSYRTDFGYRIMHMEAGYPGAHGREMHVTSETNILPDTYPFPICVTEQECQGVIK